jgi:hypothetical protein
MLVHESRPCLLLYYCFAQWQALGRCSVNSCIGMNDEEALIQVIGIQKRMFINYILVISLVYVVSCNVLNK